MSLRPLLLMVLAACATAGNSQHQGAADAPSGNGDGARSTSDAPQQHVDGGGIDSPAGSCASAFTGALASWSFTGESGSQASSPATAMDKHGITGEVRAFLDQRFADVADFMRHVDD